MEYRFNPTGVCSTEMIFDIDENDIIRNLTVVGGCAGNLKGISALVIGQKIDDVIDKLSGITCGFKPTSCPDQISKALRKYKNMRNS